MRPNSCLLFSLGFMAQYCSATHVYFGNGCFWKRQHDFIEELERGKLGRGDHEITAVTGYAGSTKQGDVTTKGDLCYHNRKKVSDYGALGHAEVVQVQLNASELKPAFEVYFQSMFKNFGHGIYEREDVRDVGPEYRSVMGFPGGSENADVMAMVHEANLHNMTLRPGVGSDPDTLYKNEVFIMDSDKFQFHQAELCFQFHDEPPNQGNPPYPQAYHALRQVLLAEGRLRKTGCPGPNYTPLCHDDPGNFLLV